MSSKELEGEVGGGRETVADGGLRRRVGVGPRRCSDGELRLDAGDRCEDLGVGLQRNSGRAGRSVGVFLLTWGGLRWLAQAGDDDRRRRRFADGLRRRILCKVLAKTP